MEVTTTPRGFEILKYPTYPDGNEQRLLQESSTMGDENPGDSFLWVGAHHHLNRDEARQLAAHINSWVETGTMIVDAPPPEDTRELYVTGAEMQERFLLRLEDAGFSPYMFNEGQANDDSCFELTLKQCLALGMSEREFEKRYEYQGGN